MKSKTWTRIGPVVIAGLVIAGLALASFVPRARAEQVARNLPCQIKSAKNVSSFPAGTQFTISRFETHYAYTCNGDEGQWDEVITSTLPPFRVPNGTLDAAP